jgi:hypothetical protein
MIYESTGEVRVPRKGEQFLMFHPEEKVTHKIHPPLRFDDEFMGDSPRVIMRPVEEGKQVVGYQVVLTIPSAVPLDSAPKVAKAWVDHITRSNPTVNPEIKEIYA